MKREGQTGSSKLKILQLICPILFTLTDPDYAASQSEVNNFAH